MSVDVHFSENEGESLYHEAQTHSGADVLKNDITGEAYVLTEDNAVPLHREPVKGVMELCSIAPTIARLWHDNSVTALLADPAEYEVLEFARDYMPEDVELYTPEDGFEYIDDHTTRGGMIYRERDYQFIRGYFYTRPWAEENPKEYLGLIANSDPIASVKLLDQDQIENAGYVATDEYEHGMYRSSSRDNPEEIRSRLEAHPEVGAVVFTIDDRRHPFETTGSVYILTEKTAA